MNSDGISLVSLANKLDSCHGDELKYILKMLRSSSYVKEELLKTDLNLFSNKVLKLIRSSDDYSIWKGCHIIIVLCSYNPVVLVSQSGYFLHALCEKLEEKAGYYSQTVSTYQGKVIISTLIESIDLVMNLTRGKPALTRESLTPKLPMIIPILISLTQLEPNLCLPVLKRLLYKNTSTCKPYASKLRLAVINLITNNYHTFENRTRMLICDVFAYLHLIKPIPHYQDETQGHHKKFPDESWRTGLMCILCQFKPIMSLCGEILDISVNSDLHLIFEALPVLPENETEAENFLPYLNVDMNNPTTLWNIVERTRILVDLLISFISLPTPFFLRTPLGNIINIFHVLLNMTTNYLPLKRGLKYNSDLISVISDVLPQLQFQGIRLIKVICDVHGLCILPHLRSIMASLELFIPLKKDSLVNYSKCIGIKYELFHLTELVHLLSDKLPHNVDDIELFHKLVDVSLYLLNDQSMLDGVSGTLNNASPQTSASKHIKKQKKNSRLNAGGMSDLFSHPQSFVIKTDLKQYDLINSFFCVTTRSWKLKSVQQIKIIRYCIIKSLTFKETLGFIPPSFINLLQTLVLFPGSERTSILPIAVSLLKETGNDIFELFCNPRLPVSSFQAIEKYNKSEICVENSISDNDDSKNGAENDIQAHMKMTQTDFDSITKVQVQEFNSEQDSSKLTKKRLKDQSPEFLEKRIKLEHATEQTVINNEPSPHIQFSQEVLHREDHKSEIKSEFQEKPIKLESKMEEIVVTNNSNLSINILQEIPHQKNDKNESDESEFEIPDINVSDDDE